MRLTRLIAALLSVAIPTSSFAHTIQGRAVAPSAAQRVPAAPVLIAPGLGGTLSLQSLSAEASLPAASAPILASEARASAVPAPARTEAQIAALKAAWNSEAVDGEHASAPSEDAKPGGKLFDGEGAKASGVPATKGFRGLVRGWLKKSASLQAAAQDRESLKLHKRLLGDGTAAPDGTPMKPFSFRTARGEAKARSAGLEGFFYSRRELARAGESTLGQLDDQFRYLDALLASVPSARPLREELARLKTESAAPAEKDRRLDALLAAAVEQLRERVSAADPSAEAARRNATYMIFSRAYNRLKPGKTFFDSLDEAEILRIKNDPKILANEIWPMDIFEIGEINRWGTGGGSSYSIKGYRVKAELGGDKAFKAFVRRAHAAGMRVKVDFIPNHTSLDSEMVRNLPEGFLHVLPPQNLSDEQIMAAVPHEHDGKGAPIYKLVKADSYPMADGTRRPVRVLIHHPRTDYGDVMWIDLAQIDYSRPEARAWQERELSRLFIEFGVDSARRDMAYEVLNARYHHRWEKILTAELAAIPQGWMRDGHVRMMEGFKRRWNALGGVEFLEQATDAVKRANPKAVMIDEAYGHTDELSRSGSDGVYNKNDHDSAQGQIGLYDAMQSGDAARIRAALKHAAFRRWQRGGAPAVNFIGTHDGGEGNPVDKFGRRFKAAALTALMLRPILLYNGFEQGVGQAENVIGDLSKSVDRDKALPYDIPVKIDWSKSDAGRQSFLELALGVGSANQELFDRGAMDVLETDEKTPIAAWTVSRGGKTFLMAANWEDGRASGIFRFARTILDGAFAPRAEGRYLLRDLANRDSQGRPFEYVREGKDLLEKGLYVELEGGGLHLFEVVDLSVGPSLAPPSSFSARWDRWTQRLTDSAAAAFLALQVPQIIQNVSNLSAGHPEQLANLPWMGYSTGILGNMLLLSWFASQKEKSAARVQAIGVATSMLVVGQIAMAGFMPAAAFWTVGSLVAGGLALNWLKFRDKAPAALWSAWSRAASLLGLVILPQVLWATFAPASMFSYLPGIAAGAAGLGMIALERAGRLPKVLQGAWTALSAWTATLLFMYGPVAQLMANAQNPAGMAGISILTLLLATGGNLLMLPRAMLTKNVVWMTGSGWSVFAGGWAVLLTMWLAGYASGPLFWGLTAFLPLYLGSAHLLNVRSRANP